MDLRALIRSPRAVPACCALLVLLLSVPAGAQEGEPVAEVVVTGEVGVDHALLRANLRTRQGEPLSESHIDEDTRYLANEYGILADVVVSAGPVVTFDLTRIQRFTRVVLMGNDSISSKELMGVGRLREGADAIPDEVSRARELIRDEYRERGYAFVQVELSIDASTGQAALVVFEGPKVQVTDVAIQGLTALDADDVLAVLSSTPGWFAWILGNPLVRSRLDRDVLTLETFVRGDGYLDARVALSALEWSDDRSEVVVHLYVDQGERYTIRSMKVEGNRRFSDSQILGGGELGPGSYFRRGDVARFTRRVARLYGNDGFIEMSIVPVTVFDEHEPVLDLVWRVEEGVQKTVRDVVVRGNVGTRDDVIRRALTVYPGDIVSLQELQWSEDALISTGYFQDFAGTPQVRVRTEDTADPDQVDVVVDVGDDESGLFAFQVGAGSDSGIFGGVSIDKRNFDISRSASSWSAFLDEFFGAGDAYHGGGQRFRAEVIPGTETTQVDLLFEDPWLDSADPDPWGLTTNLYNRRRFFDEYDRDNTGLYLGVRKRLSREQSVSVGLRGESVDVSDVNTTPMTTVPAIAAAEGDRSKVGLEARWNYQELDSLSEPTDGKAGSLFLELSTGDTDVRRLVATGEDYTPIGETDEGLASVLHSRLALGVVGGSGDLDPITSGGVPIPGSPDDDDLPFYEKLFVGGASGPFAMRGFDYRGLGPHQDEEAIGGELAMVASLEAIYPLITRYNPFRDREEATVKGVFFLEAGNLVPDTEFGDLFSDIRLAAGAGLRVRMPALGGVTFSVDVTPFVSDQSEDETRLINFDVSRRF